MNTIEPVIVTPRDCPEHALLIDKNAVMLRGESLGGGAVALAAVNLGDLRAGEIMINRGTRAILWPAPVHVHSTEKAQWLKPNPPEARGIHHDAAIAMLALAESKMPVTWKRRHLTVGAPAKDWNHWAFMAAWFWSKWEDQNRIKKVSWAARWEDMKGCGYPSSQGAFEKLARELFPKPTD